MKKKSPLKAEYCIFLSFFLLLFISCKNDVLNDCSNKQSNSSLQKRIFGIENEGTDYSVSENDQIILGEYLHNPYEISNMYNAYTLLVDYYSITSLGYSVPAPYVNTIYFRVRPTSTSEYEIVVSDTSIVYSDVPFDCDVVQEGSYLSDPDFENDIYPWMYAVVPYGTTLPNVSNVEVLQQCYVPSEQLENDTDPNNAVALLEFLAYKISGNVEDWNDEETELFSQIIYNHVYYPLNQEETNQSSVNSVSYTQSLYSNRPQGQFRVVEVDNVSGRNAVEGLGFVKIQIHKFVKFYNGITNPDGSYVCNRKFHSKKVYYNIYFNNYYANAQIWGNRFWLGAATQRFGKHDRAGFSHDFKYTEKAWRWAVVSNQLLNFPTSSKAVDEWVIKIKFN